MDHPGDPGGLRSSRTSPSGTTPCDISAITTLQCVFHAVAWCVIATYNAFFLYSYQWFANIRPLNQIQLLLDLFFVTTCRKCGARRIDRQLGLEPTPSEYVERMVSVFREVRRVLAPHGTCLVNLGDSYMGGGGGNYGTGVSNTHGQHLTNVRNRPDFIAKSGCKAKDLVGIPWMVAFALRADGWYLRSDIIWAKPNPMPESVTDRPTKAHEYVFLLAKQPRYFFDQEAVRESYQPDSLARDGRAGLNGCQP